MWIEERNDGPCLFINPRDIGSFEAIARKASQADVGGAGGTAVTLGNDVIDLESGVVVGLGHPAVFAAAMSALPDQLFERTVHAC